MSKYRARQFILIIFVFFLASFIKTITLYERIVKAEEIKLVQNAITSSDLPDLKDTKVVNVYCVFDSEYKPIKPVLGANAGFRTGCEYYVFARDQEELDLRMDNLQNIASKKRAGFK